MAGRLITSTDIATGLGARRRDVILARLRALKSDGAVPGVSASPPTFTVGANNGSPVISPYVELGMTSSKLTWAGYTKAILSSGPFYAGGRTAASVRFVLGGARRFEARIKRLGSRGFSMLVDGQKVMSGPWGASPGTSGLRVNGDAYVLADFGSNTTSYAVADVQIASGGSGHAIGDVITLSGGTSTTAAKARVTAVSAGVITGLEIADPGVYSVKPSNPVSQASSTGAGTSATFTVIWQQAQTTAKTRKIEIFLDSQTYMGGLVVQATSATVSPVVTPSYAPRLIVTGDSFTDYAFVDDIVDLWAIRLGYRLGLQDGLIPDGISGSGYLALNGKSALSARVAGIVAQSPDAMILALGLNEYLSSSSTSDLQAAVTANIDSLHSQLPNLLISVLTPWYATSGYINAVKNGVAAAADQNRVRVIDLDAAGIYTAGASNSLIVASDSVHPANTQGHAYLADLIAPLAADAFGQMAAAVMGF